MADSKITNLTGYTPPIATDVIPIVDVTTGTTKKITVANLGGTSSPLTVNGFAANSTPTANNIPVLDANALLPASLLLKSKLLVATRDFAAAGAPTDVAYTGVGFTPTSIIALAVLHGSVDFIVGFADSAKTQDGLTRSYDGNMYHNANIFLGCSTAAGAYQNGVLKSFDADGFTLTWTKGGSPTGTFDLYFLCFR